VLLDGKGEKKEDNIRGKHGDYLWVWPSLAINMQ
jgi:hypothetical protein